MVCSLLLAAVFGVAPAMSHREAVAFSLADAERMPPQDRCFQQYLFNTDPGEISCATHSFALNTTLNASSRVQLPTILAGGYLMRIDLRRWLPQEADFIRFAKLRETLDVREPYFHVTRDDFRLVDCAPYKHKDGHTYKQKWQAAKVTDFAAHAGIETQARLAELLQTRVPIMRADWFLVQASKSTNQGIYYQLVGITRDPHRKDKYGNKITDQQAFLLQFGVPKELITQLRSDQRIALFQSQVTGKPRGAEVVPTVGTRPENGPSLAGITHDQADDDVRNAAFHPLRNLLNADDRAREVIAHRPSGGLAFGLFAKRDAITGEPEALQDDVPDDIAKDHTVPAPNTARLEACIGCIRCHASDGGHKSLGNDVREFLLSVPKELRGQALVQRLNIFGDLSDATFRKFGFTGSDDVVDRLAGLYTGDLREAIRKANEAHAKFVWEATGGGIVGHGLTAERAYSAWGNYFNQYQYDMVTTNKACRELGYYCDDEADTQVACKMFHEALPPMPRIPEAALAPGGQGPGIAFEDPVIERLRKGGSITRADWETIFADAAVRVEAERIRKAKDKAKEN